MRAIAEPTGRASGAPSREQPRAKAAPEARPSSHVPPCLVDACSTFAELLDLTFHDRETVVRHAGVQLVADLRLLLVGEREQLLVVKGFRLWRNVRSLSSSSGIFRDFLSLAMNVQHRAQRWRTIWRRLGAKIGRESVAAAVSKLVTTVKTPRKRQNLCMRVHAPIYVSSGRPTRF